MKSFALYFLVTYLISGSTLVAAQGLVVASARRSGQEGVNGAQSHRANAKQTGKQGQKPVGNAIAVHQGKPRGHRPGPPAPQFETVQTLVALQPTAVSIEVRCKKGNYAAAIKEYNSQFAKLQLTDIEPHVSQSDSYSYAYPNSSSPTQYTEILVLNTDEQPKTKLKAGVVWYTMSTATTLSEMQTQYQATINIGLYEGLEAPGESSVGVRDSGRKTTRAVLHKRGAPLSTKEKKTLTKGYDDGVIINPPIP